MLNGLRIFSGDASRAEARVYAALDASAEQAECRLSGTLRGPECAYATTLQATLPLNDCGPGRGLLAMALVPDPCSWSPELPFLYRARISLEREGRQLASCERLVGIKTLATRGERLMVDGKPWIVRGVQVEKPEISELPAWREAVAAMVVHQPADELLEAASRLGVWIVALIDDPAEIARLERYAAVAMAILPAGAKIEPLVVRRPGGMLLGQKFAPGEHVEPAQWCRIVLVEDESVDRLAARAVGLRLPTLVRLAGERPLSAGRAACDTLQRYLAPHGQFAGYLV